MKIEDVKSITVLLAGYKVILRELNDEIFKRARDTMVNGRFGLKGAIERGKLTQDKMDEALARLTLTTKEVNYYGC